MSEEISVSSSKGIYHVQFGNSPTQFLHTKLENRAIVVVDRKILELYPNILSHSLFEKRLVLIEAIEENKTFKAAGDLLEHLLFLGLKRNDLLVALGGGIIQDLVSFTASVYMRGIEWHYVPTTLLSIADSCIGGKTSINLSFSKNTVGTFHPPSSVYVDLNFLKTLGRDEIQSGIGEMLHYFVYSGSPYLKKILEEYDSLFTNFELLKSYVKESLAIKKTVIEKDEFDQGERRKFNYGHTFGHALEVASGFTIQHGQAVTIGMAIANRISEHLDLLSKPKAERLNGILRKNFPAIDGNKLSITEFIDNLRKDKKNTGSKVTCILCRDFGKLEIKEIEIDQNIKSCIEETLQSAGFSLF
ncbi:hypothetical protein CH373_12160 [Leptospira perolatii]|uniref:Uncharacterized protein n=1 Tax=Leptospira perolatii TaxID=2023191 RepID=A0A2M9ZL43_9LEPT|nr:iron-containing alcohol dehydrogenase [Leptospira perolatii]PJZ70306.1 hypothetical protein CH360_06810 [Leptospira perolatii]PJZ72810.1 hypothetical protein CH373_12160 [Leptospira perolatii]